MYVNSFYRNVIAIVSTSAVVVAVTLYLFPHLYVHKWFASQYYVYNDKPKMLIVWRNGLGERELGARIMKVMPKLGVNVKFVNLRNDKKPTIFDQKILDKPAAAAAAMQPDFILVIDRAVPPVAGFRNYVVLDQHPGAYIKQDQGKFEFIKPYHYQFNGLFPAFKEIDLLQQVYEAQGKPYVGLPWRPTVHSNNYQAQTAKRLFYPGGSLSDATRGSEKYKQVMRMLDQTGYFEVYGWKERWKHTPNSYRGFIPIDGESLQRINNRAGISLLLHDMEHFNAGVPTGRIFEAAAANTIMISDKHPFIIEHFGDNVLYIDVDQDAEHMFKQIDQHVQWIFAHPEEAKIMANRCHAIFLQKFTLEDQMRRVLELAIPVSQAPV
ncbi:MAG TPA: glycosyltransferase [Gammaproteobacteria bacterium]|nr:glycosyltransferase [Gammaproteobacteria bacterium]